MSFDYELEKAARRERTVIYYDLMRKAGERARQSTQVVGNMAMEAQGTGQPIETIELKESDSDRN